MKLKILILACLMVFSVHGFTQKTNHQPKNVVLILIDGYRWQELYRGAEKDLLLNPKFNTMDSLQRMKEFWSDNINERREKLMPFTWNYVVNHGQMYGNRDLGNNVNVKNPYWISYPGRAEVLGGFVDLKINSNSYGINTNSNILEFLNHQKEYKEKVVTFACWSATGRCLNKPNSKMLINVPWKNSDGQMIWENIEGENLTNEEVLANQIQHWAPKVFGDDERLDFEVYALAKSYIQSSHPKVIYIDFGDTDEYAHDEKYDSYLLDAHNLDAMIQHLWEMMQKDPFYKDNTDFYIVPDHGRGTGNEWTSHDSEIPHSNETWFLAWGPGIKHLGVVDSREQIYQDQYAATISKLLGFEYSAGNNKVGSVIESVVK